MKHRKRLFWGLTCLLVMLTLIAGARGPVTAQDSFGQQEPASSTWMPGRVIVKYKTDMAYSTQALSNLAQFNAQRVDRINSLDVDILQVPEGDEVSVVAALNADSTVDYAELDYAIHAFVTTPNDSFFGNQWAHNLMNSTEAWDITTGSNSVTIAILDSGIDETHPDFAGKIVGGYDYVDSDSNPHDLNGHGTHVAGIAAATSNNSTGIAGMSWGAKIMPMRVLDTEGNGSIANAATAIMDAIAAGVDIINMSLGGPYDSSTMTGAIDQACAAGVVVIAAAGNKNSSIPFYPAANDHVIAVSATGPTDAKASYSNFGSYIDVAAPGGDMSYYPNDPAGIYSTMPTYDVHMTTTWPYFPKDYAYLNGTSQATPYVAGLAALLLSLDSTLTVDDVESILETTAVDFGATGFDVIYGHGRVNAKDAVLAVEITPDAPVLAAISNPDKNGTYDILWSNILNAASYVLEESSWADFRSVRNSYNTTAISMTITSTPPDVWYYRVKAVNGSGESDWSDTRSVDVVPPTPVIQPIVNAGEPDAYAISWNAVIGADGYELLQGEDNTYVTSTTRYMGSSLTYTVTGQAGGTWFYKVRAYNEAGNGLYSNDVMTTVITAPLQSPELGIIVNPDKVEDYSINWTKVITNALYVLEESTTPYFDNPSVIYTGTSTSHTVNGQSVGTWAYRVRAYHNTKYSAWSNTMYTTVETDTYLPVVLKDSTPTGAASLYDFD